MANIKFTLIVVAALVVIISLNEVHGLKCLHCGGKDFAECTEESKGESQECEKTLLGFNHACWKTTTKKVNSTKRLCGYMGESGCHTTDKIDYELCMCDSDDCNGIGRLHGRNWIQISIFSLNVLLIARFLFLIGD